MILKGLSLEFFPVFANEELLLLYYHNKQDNHLSLKESIYQTLLMFRGAKIFNLCFTGSGKLKIRELP